MNAPQKKEAKPKRAEWSNRRAFSSSSMKGLTNGALMCRSSRSASSSGISGRLLSVVVEVAASSESPARVVDGAVLRLTSVADVTAAAWGATVDVVGTDGTTVDGTAADGAGGGVSDCAGLVTAAGRNFLALLSFLVKAGDSGRRRLLTSSKLSSWSSLEREASSRRDEGVSSGR